MIGTVDPFDGAGRAAYIQCRWWKQETVVDSMTGKERLDVVCHRIEPDGMFMAEEIQPQAAMMSGAGDIRFQRYTVTISTINDVIGVISPNDIVEYDGRIWKVENISPTRIWARNQFSRGGTSGSKVIVLVS